MKLHLKFKDEDKPEEMGLDQIIKSEDLDNFLLERIEILKDYSIVGNTIYFTKEDYEQGIIYMKEVSDSFGIENL